MKTKDKQKKSAFSACLQLIIWFVFKQQYNNNNNNNIIFVVFVWQELITSKRNNYYASEGPTSQDNPVFRNQENPMAGKQDHPPSSWSWSSCSFWTSSLWLISCKGALHAVGYCFKMGFVRWNELHGWPTHLFLNNPILFIISVLICEDDPLISKHFIYSIDVKPRQRTKASWAKCCT